METILVNTPLWLGLILVVLGYAANILIKWIDLKTNKETFSLSFWWETNYLNVILSLVLITILLIVAPQITDLVDVKGSESLGERFSYVLIGYMPYKLFKALIPNKK